MEYELLLLNIYRDTSGYSESFNDSIGQYLLASYLRMHDFVGQVYAGTVNDCKKVITNEIEKQNTNIIGFYAAADNIRIVSHVIKWIKSNYDVVTIVGGPQAIALDVDFFNETGNDYAIVGEGEIPMLHLLSYLVDGIGNVQKIPSIKYFDKLSNRVVWNKCNNAIIANLDEISFPHIEDSLTGKLRMGRMVGIITGRGCPNQCTFCYEGANAKNVRFRSIANVMKEIDYITYHNPNVEYINVYDDTFTLNVDRVLEFCKCMRDRNLRWFCEGHVSFVNKHPDILKIMVESGLTCIQFGIESGSDLVLSAYNKQTTKEDILNAIEICKASGIHGITGNFIIGGAKETKDTIRQSKQLAAEMLEKAKGIMEIYTVYFAPYPNTKMVTQPEIFDIEISEQLTRYSLNTMRSPVIRTQALTTEEIFREKHDFELFLSECYRLNALNSTKEDIKQGLFQDRKRIHINPTWEAAYAALNHIDVFLRHLSEEEQEFSADSYIIRTFEDFVISKDKMITDVGVFTGIEKEVLLNATGILTAFDMAKKFSVSMGNLESVFYELNKKCLVYSSIW